MQNIKKKIAIIGASTGQIPLCKKAHEMGLDTYCFAWEQGAVCRDLVDHFYPISIFDTDKIAEICQAEGIEGVVSNASERTAEAVSKIVEKLQMTGTPYSVLHTLHDKYLVRSLTKHIDGLDVPHYYKYQGLDEGLYPCVVKPCEGAAKVGVSFANNASEFAYAIAYAKKVGKEEFLVEEYIKGKELSVESISYHGEHFVIQITDKDSSGAPHFVELGHHQPAILPVVVEEKIKRVIPQLLSAIGYNNGASHIELKYNGDKIYLIEANLRGGGGEISNTLVQMSTGVDYLKCMIEVALDCFEPPVSKKLNYAGIYFLCRQTADLLTFLKKGRAYPWCVKSEIYSEDLLESHSNYERNGYLIYKANHKITAKDIDNE